MSKILVIGLSPAVQKSILFKNFELHEVNRSTEYYTDAAGKCINVSRVLIQSGLEAECLTISGVENSALFKDLCARDGIPVTLVPTGRRVRTCTTIIDTGAGDCTEMVVNEPERVTPEEQQQFIEAFLKMIDTGYAAVIIAGSRLGGYTEEIIPFMVEEAVKRAIPVTVDIKGRDLRNSFISQQLRPDYVKINEAEFLETFDTYDTLENGLKAVTLEYGNAFVISRGSASSLICDRGEITEIPSRKLVPVNPIGCGDSMTAGLTGGLVEGRSLVESVQQGIAYAARNVLSVHPGWIKDN